MTTFMRSKRSYTAKHGAIDMNTTGAAALLGTILLAGAAVLAPAAHAATDDQWSDNDYLTASRCAGLAQGSKMDTTHIDALLKDHGAWRLGFISERAENARSDATRLARRASPAQRQHFDAELAGYCQAYLNADAIAQVKKGS